MSVIPIDWGHAREAAERATHDVAALLSEVRDPTAPVPGLDWTVGEVGAHLVTLAHGYAGFARGESSAVPPGQNFDDENARRLQEFTIRDPQELARMLVEGSTAFHALIEADDSRMTLGDVPIDRGVAAGVWTGELRLHGLDIARALRRRWRISREDALLTTYSALPMAPHYVNGEAARGLHATYEIRFRGGETIAMRFDDGRLTVTRGRTAKADCRISADPEAALLIGYGRISRWTAALKGKVVGWGRKPWLLLRFNDLIVGV
ncbi:MAG: maleylpyruvate isomerase family mycothiol-dependent enzyme [Actinomycetota bacterium]